jgi:hypothetical protein
MQHVTGCETCAALWKAYSQATMEHVQISSKLQLAAIEHDSEALKTLEPLAQTAEQMRKDARQAIVAHEAVAHPEESSAPEQSAEHSA